MSKTDKVEVPVKTNTSRGKFIVGPLGIWVFPFLNAFLQFVMALRSANTPSYYGSEEPKKKIYQLVRDENGRIVEIMEVEL